MGVSRKQEATCYPENRGCNQCDEINAEFQLSRMSCESLYGCSPFGS
jgi:hypothetical protein